MQQQTEQQSQNQGRSKARLSNQQQTQDEAHGETGKQMQQAKIKAAVLADALPYLRDFNQKIMVIGYFCSNFLSGQQEQMVMQDIALLKSVGMKPVIVHDSRIGADKFRENKRFAKLVELCGVKMCIRDSQYINLLIDRGVDGIILSGSGFYRDKRQELVEYIQSFGIPVVSADSLMQADKVMNVCSDNLLGGYRATAHLLELGHTKIGCITGPIEREGNNGSASRRYQGYRTALKEYGIPFQERYVAHGEFNIRSGMECTPHLIEQGVTAIVAANDLCAYGIYKWAKEHHVRIPEDCSVIGYDDIQYSDFFNPSLTTIRQPAHKVGYEAARKIIEYTDDGEGFVQEDIIYQPELIIRESTCAPGKGR